MHADEFRDLVLGLIFYEYVSELMLIYANSVLVGDKIDF